MASMQERSFAFKAAARMGDRARAALLKASGAGPRPNDRSPMRFMFTIDTEISMGGALADHSFAPVGAGPRIWGKTARGTAGIDLFMDLFDEFGMRGVFFYEVCGQNLTRNCELESAARHIVGRGHDVELHVHPEFKMDLDAVRRGDSPKPSAFLSSYSQEDQVKLLCDTAKMLESWTGRAPIAFRAGGFAADESTVQALTQTEIEIDSSYNMWSVDMDMCSFGCNPRLNDVALLPSDILEVPVTCYRANGPKGGLRQFDLASLNTSEAIALLEDLYAAGTRVCTSVTHSFRLLKTTDVQYTDARPDAFNIHRLRALCRYLDAHRDRFEVCTYRDLPVQQWKTELAGAQPEPYVPEPPVWTSLARLAVQATKDRGAL